MNQNYRDQIWHLNTHKMNSECCATIIGGGRFMSQTLIGSSTRTVKVNLTQNSPFSPFYSVRTQLKINGDNRNRWEHLWWYWNRRLFVWWCLKIVSIEFQWNHALFTKKKKILSGFRYACASCMLEDFSNKVFASPEKFFIFPVNI